MHSPVDEAGVRAARVRVERTVRETEAALARLCEGLATGLAGEGYR